MYPEYDEDSSRIPGAGLHAKRISGILSEMGTASTGRPSTKKLVFSGIQKGSLATIPIFVGVSPRI